MRQGCGSHLDVGLFEIPSIQSIQVLSLGLRGSALKAAGLVRPADAAGGAFPLRGEIPLRVLPAAFFASESAKRLAVLASRCMGVVGLSACWPVGLLACLAVA